MPRRVSLVAIPDGTASTLYGIYDALNAMRFLGGETPSPFDVRIVAESAAPLRLASGLTVDVHQPIDAVEASDVVIVPSVIVPPGGWRTGRQPRLVNWLRRMHAGGAVLCSACSGIFLIAETGLFDGRDATVHYDYARLFGTTYPAVRVHPDRVLVVSGRREELLSSGASTTWHDLVLHLFARYAGADAAMRVARMFALQWHHDGLGAYVVFEGRSGHGDAEIEAAQQWLATHFPVASPVEAAIERSRLAERTFKRRFVKATGLSPIAYVQRLRVEAAKRRLERSDLPVDEVSWQVGYEDPAFFRRLFKRVTGLTPAAYRRRFQVPRYARPNGPS